MPYGTTAPVLVFAPGAPQQLAVTEQRLPDWVSDAMEEAADSDDFDRRMAMTGAICVESYGLSVEHIDVWKLPDNAGWLVIHEDGDSVDAITFIHSIADFMLFQPMWLAPMAQKIMAEDRYFMWQKEINDRMESEPKFH